MILTVEELRQHIVTGLTDDALLRLLEATEADIDARLGSATSVTERLPGGHELLVLGRPAGTITSVTETADDSPLVLATNDYRVEGYILRRLDTGTNPSDTWDGPVDVVHVPVAAADAGRARAQVALVKIELAQSGYSSEATQDESRAPWEYQVARKRVLDSLVNDAVLVA